MSVCLTFRLRMCVNVLRASLPDVNKFDSIDLIRLRELNVIFVCVLRIERTGRVKVFPNFLCKTRTK